MYLRKLMPIYVRDGVGWVRQRYTRSIWSRNVSGGSYLSQGYDIDSTFQKVRIKSLYRGYTRTNRLVAAVYNNKNGSLNISRQWCFNHRALNQAL